MGGIAAADVMLTIGPTASRFDALPTYPFVPSKTDSTVNVPSFGIIGKYSVSVTAA